MLTAVPHYGNWMLLDCGHAYVIGHAPPGWFAAAASDWGLYCRYCDERHWPVRPAVVQPGGSHD